MGKSTIRMCVSVLGLFTIMIALFVSNKREFGHSKAKSAMEQEEKITSEIVKKSNILPNLTKNGIISYSNYKKNHKENDYNGRKITISANSYLEGMGIETLPEYEGVKNAIYTEEQGYVTWQVEIEEAGLYAIGLTYYPVKGYGGNIERNITIDGVLPFEESEGVEFTRIYEDEILNPSGSKIRPNQVEKPRWNHTYVKDSFGYFGSALYYYMEEGLHTITLTSVKEPMIIGDMKLHSEDLSSKSYEAVLKENMADGAEKVSGALDNGVIIIQAENTYEKGDPTLYSVSDSTSTKNQPFDYKYKLMNGIGGLAWKYSNQWISWTVDIPESGLYHIGARSKQNYVRDIYCNRTLYIDGEIPFLEASNLHFSYDDEWKVKEFGEEEPYLFYLEKGQHTITLEVTAGDLQNILTEADSILNNLNAINMELLALLSINPDVDRDYQIGRFMPQTVLALEENAGRLEAIYNELLQRTGKNDTLTSQLEQLITLINKMHSKPDKIAGLYSRYRELVGTFGNWIMTVREHPLILDYLYIAEPDASINKKEDGFFKKLYQGAVEIYYSFVTDASVISDNGSSEAEEEITVWIGSGLTGGRDQAMALNQMINQSFTKQYGIHVNLQLVPENTILMATLAGRGPDVALQMDMAVPVDYALRNAAYDLSKFKDYEEISERFFDSATEPFELNGGVYALPETMSFPMLFYRTDILDNLGISLSQLKTWEGIVEILPILQGKNMNFALPTTMPSYSMFLYQMGGEYYTPDYKASNLSSKTALDAFLYWTDFYSMYSLPIDFSFENRFRTGEMPIGIADYTTYNLLSISAPEIKGKWAMVSLPGMEYNGKLRNVAPIAVKGCVLMNHSENKEAAWEFMKWWTDQEAQYEFGNQLEAVMGAAARYNTANKEAFMIMPWAAADRNELLKQAMNIKGIPQIPGGYYTERNLNFAKLAVFNSGEDPREQLTNYADNITDEIAMKRKEFDLEE